MLPSDISNIPICQKDLEDRWNGQPPQVTSVITYPRLEPSSEQSIAAYNSPVCGFGWRFQVIERFQYRALGTAPRSQELIGCVDLSFETLYSSLPFGDVTISVKVTYPTDESQLVHEKEFCNVSLKANCQLGSYSESVRYKGKTHIKITLSFNVTDDLSLLTILCIYTKTALFQSLDNPSFIDTKFYLYLAKSRGRAVLPKAIFAKSLLLVDSGHYLRHLLSTKRPTKNGTPCDLRQDVPEEIAKLRADLYDYDSNGDLESLPDTDGDDEGSPEKRQQTENVSVKFTINKDEGKAPVSPPVVEGEGTQWGNQPVALPQTVLDGWAFAINVMLQMEGLDFYTYTNEISRSPKSMYQFADHADLPKLKALAREGVRNGLSKSNVITELFSTFTSEYQAIIEIETDFLLEDFTPVLAKELDEMLQLVATGAKPHCYCVLAFIMQRLCGESTEAAWQALVDDELTPHTEVPSSEVPSSPQALGNLERRTGTSGSPIRNL